MVGDPSSSANFLPTSGGVADLIRGFDWSSTPIGPLEAWPQSLKTITGFLLRSPTPIVLLWGVQGVMIYNDAYSVFAGARHPDLLGMNVREAWPEVAAFNDNVMRVGLAGGTLTYSDQELVLNRSGRMEPAWLDLGYSPVIDESGKPGGVIAIVIETTERVLARRRQADATARQRRQFEQAPGFIIVMGGPEHTVEFANDTHRRVFGSDDWVGKTIRDAFPSIAGQGFYEILDQVYETGETVQFEAAPVRYRRTAAGPEETRYLSFIYAPISDETGAVSGVFCDGFDVTDRVLLEHRREALVTLGERLRRAETVADLGYAAAELLGESLGVSRVGYGTIDPVADTLQVERDWTAEGVDTLAGVTALREYGSFIDSLKRNEFISITDVRDDPRTAPAAAALEGRSARAFVNVPIVEQGKLVAVLFLNHGEVRVWAAEDLALIREVAERTRTAVERARGEAALRLSEARLREVNESLEASIESRTRELLQAEEALRQSQKMEAVGQLTGGIAHDFNNLLAGIGGGLEMLEKRLAEGRGDSVQRYIDLAQASTRRAAALTQRLLAFSRRQTLDPKPTDANRLVAEMEDLVRRTVGPAIAVETVIAPDLWLTEVDPSQLENALLNLAINARDAMPDGGRITVVTNNRELVGGEARERDLAAGQYICLSVADTGSGMSAEVAGRAFDPFFTTKPLGQGTGLGLSMIHGFVRQSGGTVRIETAPGAGTTVHIYLPRYFGKLAPAEAPETATGEEAGLGETVLVIDDEAAVRSLVVEVLEDAGYRVLQAEDGQAGLAILDTDRPIDLLITDVGLPGGVNGRQVADVARLRRRHLKVLFITGYAEQAVLDAGRLEPGMQVVTKPFSMAVLGARVREILEG